MSGPPVVASMPAIVRAQRGTFAIKLKKSVARPREVGRRGRGHASIVAERPDRLLIRASLDSPQA
jgi:hypothetical protein